MGNFIDKVSKIFDIFVARPPPRPNPIDQSILEEAMKREREERDKERAKEQQEKQKEMDRLRDQVQRKEKDLTKQLSDLEKAQLDSVRNANETMKRELEKRDKERAKEQKEKQKEMNRLRDHVQRKEKDLAKKLSDLDMEKAKLDSRSANRYEHKEPKALEFLRQQAYEKLGLDTVHKINVCITGKTGSGKSTLNNGLRKLDPDDPMAAKVDVNECTGEISKYVHPKAAHLILWDVPGADTTNHPRETYFYDKYLYAFDNLLIVFTERFTEAESDLIKQAMAHKVPFALVRNKANVDFASKRKTDKDFRTKTKEEAIDALIKEHKAKTVEYLIKAEIPPDDVPIFVINAYSLIFPDEIIFEEEKLVEHALRVICKRRGYDEVKF